MLAAISDLPRSQSLRKAFRIRTTKTGCLLVIDYIGHPEAACDGVVEHRHAENGAWRLARRTLLDPGEHLRCHRLLIDGAETLEVRLGGGAYEDRPGHADWRPRRPSCARNSSLSLNPRSEPSSACRRTSLTGPNPARGGGGRAGQRRPRGPSPPRQVQTSPRADGLDAVVIAEQQLLGVVAPPLANAELGQGDDGVEPGEVDDPVPPSPTPTSPPTWPGSPASWPSTCCSPPPLYSPTLPVAIQPRSRTRLVRPGAQGRGDGCRAQQLEPWRSFSSTTSVKNGEVDFARTDDCFVSTFTATPRDCYGHRVLDTPFDRRPTP